MEIRYGKIILRAIEQEDFDFLFEAVNSPEINLQMGVIRPPVSSQEQKNWMNNTHSNDQCIRLIIALKEARECAIGFMLLDCIDWRNRVAHIGYKMSPDVSRRTKGDLEDALMGTLDYAFSQMGLNCVYGNVLNENIFSRKILRKAGFVEEGIMRQRLYFNNEYHDLINASILKDEFISVKEKKEI